MITYNEYTQMSNVPVVQADFPFIEARTVDLLKGLCGSRFSESDETCKKAVVYQIEYIQSLGGLTAWQNHKGQVGSHSYSIGGESESYTYVTKEGNSQSFNGLAISPLAWSLLQNGRFIQTVRGVRVW